MMKLSLLLLCSLISIESFTLNSHPLRTTRTAISITETSTTSSSSTGFQLFSTKKATEENVNDIKTKIQNEISTTKRGLSTTPSQQQSIETLLQSLETKCPLSEPARSTLMGGRWIVDYTTSPPPSNGKLGPFVGYARQIIDLEKGTYVNYLSVPGDIQREWLSATLEATFSEWDGTFLKDDRDKDDMNSSEETSTKICDEIEEDEKIEDSSDKNKQVLSSPSPVNIFSSIQNLFTKSKNDDDDNKSTNKTVDYGADSWKVNFETLTIKAFGFPLITKKFESTSRIWKMSYLDEETRIGECIQTGGGV